MPKKNAAKKPQKLASQQSLNSAIKSICDVMRRSGCAGAMKYVPELTWMLFLRILDERETREAEEEAALGLHFTPSLKAPFRWQDWAAPKSERRQDTSAAASVWKFVHEELLPHLKALKDQPGATPRQKVISKIMMAVERSRIDSEKNFLDVLDKVHEISNEAVDTTHVFTLSQVYEGLLLKMGEKGNDGGQFFTPREVIRVMVRILNPQIGQTIYDPGCGTGGFLAQAFEYMKEQAGDGIDAVQLETLRRQTFYGREKDEAVFPIALANLVLHGIDEPHLWHGNTLSGQEVYGDLFKGAPLFFDKLMMNPPFGGKEGKEAQTNFDYKTGATQVLFLQAAMSSMTVGSECGIVLDEGVLFRTNETAFVQTKRKLLEECNVHTIVSLPGGVFTAAGAGVKTNLMFFRKGEPTESIWYYDLSDVKVGKKTPLTTTHFDELMQLLPSRAGSERSWTIPFAERLQTSQDEARPHRERAEAAFALVKELDDEIKEAKKAKKSAAKLKALEERWRVALTEARDSRDKADALENAAFDIKAVNPNRADTTDKRTPAELMAFIHEKGREADTALARLAALMAQP